MRGLSLSGFVIASGTAWMAFTGCSKKADPPAPASSNAVSTRGAAPADAPSPPPSVTSVSTGVPNAQSVRLQPRSEAEIIASLPEASKQRYMDLLSECFDKNVGSCEAVCSEFGAEACLTATSLMSAKKVPDDPPKRAKMNEKGCETGLLRCCDLLGLAYANGDGVAADGKKALEYYEKACSGGDGGGCVRAANLLGYGDVVPQDLDSAKALSVKACKLGAKECEPPIPAKDGSDATWPADAKLEDVIVDATKLDGKYIQLRGVAAYRGSPTSGFIFATGGNPLTDGVATMLSDNADDEIKKAWLRMPSFRTGVPIKKVMVRVEATMVPGHPRLWIVDDLHFYGAQN